MDERIVIDDFYVDECEHFSAKHLTLRHDGSVEEIKGYCYVYSSPCKGRMCAKKDVELLKESNRQQIEQAETLVMQNSELIQALNGINLIVSGNYEALDPQAVLEIRTILESVKGLLK